MRWWLVPVLGLLLGCSKPPGAVVCTVTYGGQAKRLEFPATQSPYTVKAVDVAERFAFKAIYLKPSSISVYAYQRTSAGLKLLQEGKYGRYASSPAAAPHGFTGRQLVYSPDERELEYWCQLSP